MRAAVASALVASLELSRNVLGRKLARQVDARQRRMINRANVRLQFLLETPSKFDIKTKPDETNVAKLMSGRRWLWRWLWLWLFLGRSGLHLRKRHPQLGNGHHLGPLMSHEQLHTY